MYLKRIPGFIHHFFPDYQWKVRPHEIALTFDDGPHPESTSQLLTLLAHAEIPVTHFLPGKQVIKYPELFLQLNESRHAIGHHGFNHLNGWKVKDDAYVEDILNGHQAIGTSLFRPPYGKLTRRKWKKIQTALPETCVKMFNLMPGDFEMEINSQALLQRMKQARGGDIIVLHDTPNAFLKYAPFLVEWVHSMKEKGLEFVSLQNESIR
jgi:peptidoglycan/xylan/chitin deacetylase (PgdA/CDA1 family)